MQTVSPGSLYSAFNVYIDVSVMYITMHLLKKRIVKPCPSEHVYFMHYLLTCLKWHK